MIASKKVSYLLGKSFKLAISNIWRNKILSLATVFVTGTILFIFNIILAVNFIAKDALSDLNQKVDITVYLKQDVSYENSLELINEIKSLNQVMNVGYVSQDDALKQIKGTHPDIANAFEKYNLENPLPASINITTTDPKYHQGLIKFLSQDKYKTYFTNIINQGDGNSEVVNSVSKNLVELNKFTHQVIFWLVVIFVSGGSLIILNALQINIFTRRRELNVMKLVGASNWFIRAPFIIESIIYAAAAVLLSVIMLVLLSKNISIDSKDLWNYYGAIDFYLIFLGELGITVFLSVVSSYVAVHEHMQKDIL